MNFRPESQKFCFVRVFSVFERFLLFVYDLFTSPSQKQLNLKRQQQQQQQQQLFATAGAAATTASATTSTTTKQDSLANSCCISFWGQNSFHI